MHPFSTHCKQQKTVMVHNKGCIGNKWVKREIGNSVEELNGLAGWIVLDQIFFCKHEPVKKIFSNHRNQTTDLQ